MTTFLCGYREQGGLKVSSQWSSGEVIGKSVLGGLDEVDGGDVAGRRKKEVGDSEVRRLGLYTLCTTVL